MHALNRITYGIPFELFRIDSQVSEDERLPVISEFIIRFIYTCEPVRIESLAKYFGLTMKDATVVCRSLYENGHIDYDGDDMHISNQTREKMPHGQDYPSYTKLTPFRETQAFDLLSFTAIKAALSSANVEMVRLEPDNSCLGRSLEHAKQEYCKQFHEIRRIKGNSDKKYTGVYMIENIESRGRQFIPVTASIIIGESGYLERKFDAQSIDNFPEEMLSLIEESVSAAHAVMIYKDKNIYPKNDPAEALKHLDDYVLLEYYKNGILDLKKFTNDLITSKNPKYHSDIMPIFGFMYSEEGIKTMEYRIRALPKGGRQVFWSAPSSEFWGKCSEAGMALDKLSNVAEDGLSVILPASHESSQYRSLKKHNNDIPILCHTNPGASPISGMEVVYCPGSFAAFIGCYDLDANDNGPAPIGFVSKKEFHMNIAQQYFTELLPTTRPLNRF